MNETIIQDEQEITENSIEETEQTKESNSIYEFFKNDTSFLIAVVSALLVVVASFFKICSYIYQNGYLKYWNINSKFTSNVSSYWFETILFSFLFFVISIFSSIVISFNLPIYLNKIEVYLSIIINTYKNKRKIKKLKREIKRLKSKLSKLRNSKEKGDLNKEIIRLRKEYISINNECSSIIKSALKYSIEIIIEMSIYSFLIGLLFIIFGFPVTFQGNTNLNLSLAVIGLCYVMIVIGFIFSSIIMILIRAIKKKTLSYNRYSKEEFENIILKKPSLKHIFSLQSEGYLSNKTLIFASILVVIYMLCFLLIIIIFSDSRAKNQKEFQVISNNSNTYAIIHVDDSNIIAERIEIDDKNAVIYVNEQIIIPKENIEMNIYNFENVSKTGK